MRRPRGQRPERASPRPLTRERLQEAALAYLQRYASSSANLRRVLERRIRREERLGATDGEAARALADGIVERFVGSGLLDDRAYAEARTRGLLRRGFSRRAMEQALFAKGLPEATVRAALESLVEGVASPDLTAAVAYVRRKRLGPLRSKEHRATFRQRDMAALARRGFSFEIARRVIDAEDESVLEALGGGEDAR